MLQKKVELADTDGDGIIDGFVGRTKVVRTNWEDVYLIVR